MTATAPPGLTLTVNSDKDVQGIKPIYACRKAIDTLPPSIREFAEKMIERGAIIVEDEEEEAPPHQGATRTRRDRREV